MPCLRSQSNFQQSESVAVLDIECGFLESPAHHVTITLYFILVRCTALGPAQHSQKISAIFLLTGHVIFSGLGYLPFVLKSLKILFPTFMEKHQLLFTIPKFLKGSEAQYILLWPVLPASALLGLKEASSKLLNSHLQPL